MGFINMLIDRRREKVRIMNESCDLYIEKATKALRDVELLFENKQCYIDPTEETTWLNHHNSTIQELLSLNSKIYRKAVRSHDLLQRKDKILRAQASLKNRIAQHNENVANQQIKSAYAMIGNIEGHALDRQQMLCIVKDASNHLVIAGAGTGKTTTVIGKIKYLLKSGKCTPDDILVLSFTNASASEMSERIQKETEVRIDASTFHKLGLNIIKKVEGIVPRISQLSLRSFIKEQIEIHMQSEQYLNMLSTYILYNRVVAKSEFDFNSKAEYDGYLKLNPPTTLKNEVVKSYGEMEIANFLVQHGIQYIYEHPYKIDTRTSEYGQYIPDFYLPEYDIYIEYFGINKNGEVPAYFSANHGMNASESYNASMRWKRETHQANGTKMIECFAYEKFEGALLGNLKEHLLDFGVKLTAKSSKALWEEITKEDSSVLDGIIELFETVINLIKSNGYTINDVRRLNTNNINIQSNNLILSLIEPIYNTYNSHLRNNGEIDFNDMINIATRYIRDGKFTNPYKYVIVDEYQDISKARFNLLKSLRESSYFDLFCVGDDWQSIYRFAGSDIGFILNFENFWGKTEISKIETTYRFTRQLIEISGTFIMTNPAQIQKMIKGNRDSIGFALGEIQGYTEPYAIDFMVKKLDDLPQNSSVYFIGRYSFDGKLLTNNAMLTCSYNNVTGMTDVVYKKRRDLKMQFLTAHKSKGLQADYVFIINNKKSGMGFPSQIQDAPILDLLLESCDQFSHSEERRLFYVALTRAKKKAYIVTVKGQESEFAIELKERYTEELKKEQFECPLCGGKLLRRSGPYGEFFGCSNYRETGCKYKRNIVRKQA